MNIERNFIMRFAVIVGAGILTAFLTEILFAKPLQDIIYNYLPIMMFAITLIILLIYAQEKGEEIKNEC